jgi:hypothetical protein
LWGKVGMGGEFLPRATFHAFAFQVGGCSASVGRVSM